MTLSIYLVSTPFFQDKRRELIIPRDVDGDHISDEVLRALDIDFDGLGKPG